MSHFKKWANKYQKRGQLVLPIYSENEQKTYDFPIEKTPEIEALFKDFSAMVKLQEKLYTEVKSMDVKNSGNRVPSTESKKKMDQYLKLNQELDLMEQNLVSAMRKQIESNVLPPIVN